MRKAAAIRLAPAAIKGPDAAPLVAEAEAALPVSLPLGTENDPEVKLTSVLVVFLQAEPATSFVEALAKVTAAH